MQDMVHCVEEKLKDSLKIRHPQQNLNASFMRYKWYSSLPFPTFKFVYQRSIRLMGETNFDDTNFLRSTSLNRNRKFGIHSNQMQRTHDFSYHEKPI